jgi:NADH-quinone oxidoreductase subunit C
VTRAPEHLDAWTTARGFTVAQDAVDPVMVDVPAEGWVLAVASARDDLGLTWFDALTVVDEADGTFSVIVHLVGLGTPLMSLLVRTRIAGDPAALDSVAEIYEGAGWHERESAEMFGVVFVGSPDDRRLLLPEAFDGAPLRKDFAMAARGSRPWPGAKDPGESDADVSSPQAQAPQQAQAPKRRRRRAVPPGVPVRDDEGRW